MRKKSHFDLFFEPEFLKVGILTLFVLVSDYEAKKLQGRALDS